MVLRVRSDAVSACRVGPPTNRGRRITGDAHGHHPYPSGQSPAERAARAFASSSLPTHLKPGTTRRSGRRCQASANTDRSCRSPGRWFVCGLRLSTDDVEIILHAVSPSGLHRQQFVLHELGHMVLRHDELVVPADYIGVLFPNLPAGLVSRVLARSSFTDDLEAAAESLADLFAAAIRNSAREPRSFEKVFE